MYSLNRTFKALRWALFGQPWQRRRVRHECARIAASLFGDYPVSDDYKLWREDRTFIKKFRELSPGNYYSEDRKYTLREWVRFTRPVPGCLAECGSYKGASAWFIANEMPDVPLYLFDAFSGLPDLESVDQTPSNTSQSWQKGDFDCSIEVIRRNLSEFDHITILEGWIPDRFPEVARENFRFVHIDVDLYEPTRQALEFFYPRLNSGGVICMDDYGSTICPGAYAAAHEFFEEKPEQIISLTTGQGIVIKTAA